MEIILNFLSWLFRPAIPNGAMQIICEDGKYIVQIYGDNLYDYNQGYGYMTDGWHTVRFNMSDTFKYKKSYAVFDTLDDAEKALQYLDERIIELGR